MILRGRSFPRKLILLEYGLNDDAKSVTASKN
jgi:hypothetical protein